MNRKIIVIGLILLVFSFACSKSPKCWGDDKNKGEIIERVKLPGCFVQSTLNDGDFIIRDSSDLAIFEDCLPEGFEIDFEKYSMLGRQTEFQCNAKFIREVKIDHNTKEYNYSITIKECGVCKSLGVSDNLVLVPTVPLDYSVKFEVDYK